MERLLLVSVLVAALALPASVDAASSRPDSTCLYVELGGNAMGLSLNVDHEFTDHLSLRFGFMTARTSGGGYVFTSEERSETAVPVMVNCLFGSGNSRLETGLGTVLYQRRTRGGTRRPLLFTGTFGYRYQRPTGGFVFRVGYTPVYSVNDDEEELGKNTVNSWYGMSFGVGF